MENTSTPCPQHPGSPATLTCARCGTFACEACRSPTQPTLCAACGERYAPADIPVTDTLQEAIQFLLRRPKAVLSYAAAQAAFGLVVMPLNLRLQALPADDENPLRVLADKWPSALGLIVVSTLFTAVLYSLFLRYVGDQLAGRERPFGEVAQEALGRAPAMLGMNLLMGLAVGVGTVLCIVPGVIVALALSLAPVAVVLQSAGPTEALSFSWEKTAGHRGNLFLVLLLASLIFMGLALAGGLVGLVLGLLGKVGVALSTLVSQAVSGAGASLLLTVLVFCYLRLTGRWAPEVSSR